MVGSFLFASVALAAAPTTAPGQNKLQCFDGTTDTAGGFTTPYIFGGVCTLTSSGAKGPAVLDNTVLATDGDYSGVYILDSTLFGQKLSAVKQLSYNYSGTVAPMPGNLSLNVPVNLTGGATTDGYLFADAYYCGGVGGLVDVINDPTCGLYYNGSVFYANWAAFVAANPAAKVATDNYMFVVAERTPAEVAAKWTVSNVKLGKGGK